MLEENKITQKQLNNKPITLKNVGPFDGEGLTINFGEKKDPKKANIHILVGENGSGKSTVLKDIFYQASDNHWNSNSDNFFKKHTFSGQKILPIDFEKYLLYTPCEPMLKQSDYNFIPKNRDSGNNFISNWVVNYNEKYYLEYIENLNNRKNALIADSTLTDSQKNEISQNIGVAMKINTLIKDIYDFDFDYKYKNLTELYQPYLKGEYISFSEMSTGYRQIISLATDILIKVWNIESTLEKKEDLQFVLLLDEVDVHLHPKAQRKILPAIQKLFPNAEIFCTTHSPFVVNSVSDAWVYVLDIKSGVIEPISSNEFHGKTIGETLNDTFNISYNDLFDQETQTKLDEFKLDVKILYSSINLTTSAINGLEVKYKEFRDNNSREVNDILSFNFNKLYEKVSEAK